MKKSSYEMNLYELKKDLSMETGLGYPVFLAGILFWLFVGISSFVVTPETLVWMYVFGIGAIMPLAILISKLLRINFLSSNPLSTVAGLVGGVQLFFAPLVIMIVLHQPDWVPFAIGVLAGAHFLPYVWIYDSKVYLFQTITTVFAASFFGIVFMELSFYIVPFAISIVYGVTILLLIRQHRLLMMQGVFSFEREGKASDKSEIIQ
ncbi:hypothetical protein H839_09183 [Parageobacillus genomosp. 1]|uniref:Uncharacterized protein n=1 Tax=Parageobacillus genomosp. 1 TaxID=1295642 RepID=A0ABC9VEG1_9BACL|nr:hypothetical protein [Parageobacillus genomosp. 1]EZP76757.1 hypothetical protein H839_09183 [Parageobacillus genomosp. 1]